MSSRTSRILLGGLFSLAVVCFLNGPAPAQEKRDILDEAKQRQQVEIQHVEAEFNKVYESAKTVSIKEPAKAIAMLQDFRDRLTSNTDIPQETRDPMLRRITLAIKAYTGRATDLSAAQIPTPPVRTADKKVDDKDGRAAADEAKTTRDRIASNMLSSAEVKALREKNYLRIQTDLDKTSIPQVEDITFPADWAVKSGSAEGPAAYDEGGKEDSGGAEQTDGRGVERLDARRRYQVSPGQNRCQYRCAAGDPRREKHHLQGWGVR